MRDVTVNGLSEFDAVRPRRAPAGRGKAAGRGAKPGPVRRLVRRFRARALMLAASSCFAAIMVGIVLNATLFQKGHHPAPLFGTAAQPQPDAPALAPKVTPRQVLAPTPTAPPLPAPAAPAPAPVRAVEPTPAPATHPVRTQPIAHHAPATPSKPVDTIGQLLTRTGVDKHESTPAHRQAATAPVANKTAPHAKVRPGQPTPASKVRPATAATN